MKFSQILNKNSVYEWYTKTPNRRDCSADDFETFKARFCSISIVVVLISRKQHTLPINLC